MSRVVRLRLLITTDEYDEEADHRIEANARRALCQWFDPQRVYVEIQSKKEHT